MLLKVGDRLKRNGWQEILFVQLQKPDENSKMKKAYLYCMPLDHQLVPWTPSASDLFMEDWNVYTA